MVIIERFLKTACESLPPEAAAALIVNLTQRVRCLEMDIESMKAKKRRKKTDIVPPWKQPRDS